MCKMLEEHQKRALHYFAEKGVEISPDEYEKACNNPDESSDETLIKTGKIICEEIRLLGVEKFIEKWGAKVVD